MSSWGSCGYKIIVNGHNFVCAPANVLLTSTLASITPLPSISRTLTQNAAHSSPSLVVDLYCNRILYPNFAAKQRKFFFRCFLCFLKFIPSDYRIKFEQRFSCSGQDPPLQTPSDMLAKGLSCPTVSKLSDLKNPILLQPGTGLSGNQSFEFGYAKIAPTLGFEPCIVATTDNLLGDAQTSVEYLIYATRQVSQYAPGGKVPIFSWSLGGPLTQWMMTFFPRCV